MSNAHLVGRLREIAKEAAFLSIREACAEAADALEAAGRRETRALMQAQEWRQRAEREREIIADKAREWAAHYSPGSDGRNTFMLFAEWIGTRYCRMCCPDIT